MKFCGDEFFEGGYPWKWDGGAKWSATLAASPATMKGVFQVTNRADPGLVAPAAQVSGRGIVGRGPASVTYAPSIPPLRLVPDSILQPPLGKRSAQFFADTPAPMNTRITPLTGLLVLTGSAPAVHAA
jgi:hypothetical protein